MPNEVDERKEPVVDTSTQTTESANADFGAVLTGPTGSSDRDRDRDRKDGNDNALNASSTEKTGNSTDKSTSSEKTGNTTDKNDKAAASDIKGAESDASAKAEKSSPFNSLNLFKSFSDTVAKGAKDAIKSTQDLLPSLEIFSGGTNNSEKSNASKDSASIKTAESSDEKAQAQLDKYFGFRDSKESKGERQEPGEYKNDDGSKYQVDKNGDISQFTTAPTAERPEGGTYKASYNDKHEMVKMETPTGKSFTKTSPENDKGFAYWQEKDSKGQNIAFGTSTSAPFVGKIDLSSDGAQFMIGHDNRHPSQNTKWAGSMINFGSDGSETRSTVTGDKKTGATGFETNIIQPDGSKTKSFSKFDENGKPVKEGSTLIESKDGDSKTSVKDGEVVSKEENLKAKEKMAEIAKNLDGQDKLQNLRNATLTARGDKTHVSIDNYQAKDQSSVRAGAVLADGTKPSHTHVNNHLEFDLSKGKDGSVNLTNIEGMTGHGAKLGPLGRRWHSGSSPVREIHMVPGHDGGHASIQTRTDRGRNTAGPDLLTADAQKGADNAVAKGGDVIDFLHDKTKSAKISHPSQRGFNFDMEPKDSLKQQVREAGMGQVALADKVAGKFSYDEKGMKVADIKGITALGQNVTELKIEPGKGGEMKVTAEFVNPKTGEKGSLPLPMSQIAPMLAMFGQGDLGKKKR